MPINICFPCLVAVWKLAWQLSSSSHCSQTSFFRSCGDGVFLVTGSVVEGSSLCTCPKLQAWFYIFVILCKSLFSSHNMDDFQNVVIIRKGDVACPNAFITMLWSKVVPRHIFCLWVCCWKVSYLQQQSTAFLFWSWQLPGDLGIVKRSPFHGQHWML